MAVGKMRLSTCSPNIILGEHSFIACPLWTLWTPTTSAFVIFAMLMTSYLALLAAKRRLAKLCVLSNTFSTTLNLAISPEKSGIRKASTGVQFLGYTIRTYAAPARKVKARIGRYTGLKRSISELLQLSVPRDQVLAFARRQGYGHLHPFHAVRRPALLHCDDLEIATIYNSELRGFANYYALAHDVKRKLSKLEFLWKTSLYKTLANKHRVSVSKLYRRFRMSPDIHVVWQQVGDKRVERIVWRLATLSVKLTTFADPDTRVNLAVLRFDKTGLLARLAVAMCSACGSTSGPFHIHHLNPLRTLAGQPKYQRMASARIRKTVPLCIKCHVLRHQGRLPDFRALQLKVESRVR